MGEVDLRLLRALVEEVKDVVRIDVVKTANCAKIRLIQLLKLHRSIILSRLASHACTNRGVRRLFPRLLNGVSRAYRRLSLRRIAASDSVVFITLPRKRTLPVTGGTGRGNGGIVSLKTSFQLGSTTICRR